MGPEFWIGLAAVFVSGGAVGAAGTLLAQWIVGKLGTDDRPRSASLEAREVAALRGEMDEMARRLENLDARLDFQEQLLGGATPAGRPPPRLPPQDEEAPES